jgi:methylated-DNA-protein-cysteine methyltransferase-like protein
MPPRSPKRVEPGAPPADFRRVVLAVVAQIPKGKLASYGQVAALAGFPQRPRQVGMVLSGLPEGTDLPWHRVVNTRGYVPSRGRWWGAFEQIGRLRDEGIEVDDLGNLDLETHRWDGTSAKPRSPRKRRASAGDGPR